MGLLLLVAAILSIVFGSIWAFRGWGAGPCVAVAVVGGLVVLLVPFGTILAIIAGIVIISAAQKAKFAKVASGEDDVAPAYGGFPPSYPPPPGPARPDGPQPDSPPCPVCQTPGMHWVNQAQRWFCTTCQDYR